MLSFSSCLERAYPFRKGISHIPNTRLFLFRCNKYIDSSPVVIISFHSDSRICSCIPHLNCINHIVGHNKRLTFQSYNHLPASQPILAHILSHKTKEVDCFTQPTSFDIHLSTGDKKDTTRFLAVGIEPACFYLPSNTLKF